MAAGGGGAAGLPLVASAVTKLPSLGIAADKVSFRFASMTSDKAICVRETNPDGSGAVAIVDPRSPGAPNRRPMGAEGAIISPAGNLIAVRGKGVMQVWDLTSDSKVGSSKTPAGEEVKYWAWLNDSTVALVTADNVYHWDAKSGAAPSKACARNPKLAGAQIINYDASEDGKWLFLAGIKGNPKAGEPIRGVAQLYSVEKGKSQVLESSAGRFASTQLPGRSGKAQVLSYVTVRDGKPHLHISEVGNTTPSALRIDPVAFSTPAGAADDLIVRVEVTADDLVYAVSRSGFVYAFDLHSGGIVFRIRGADGPVFTSAVHEASRGVLLLSQGSGDLNLVKPNRDAIVPFVTTTLRNSKLALDLAGRMNLKGADSAFKSQFDALMSAGDVAGAIAVAAKSPGTVLRNAETIARLRALPVAPGARSPAMSYFTEVMKRGQANEVESVELVRAALDQGKSSLVSKWLSEGKLTSSRALGDAVAAIDSSLALRVYQSSGGSHEQVIQMYVRAGEFDKIVPYASEKGADVEWPKLLEAVVSRDPKAAQGLATALVKNASGGGAPLIQIDAAVEIFMRFNRLPECTSFLLDVLAGDRKEQGYLQTRLLEMNLLGHAPQVVDAILESDMFHHFDAKHIAVLCERSGLTRRAMELHEDIADIKRTMAAVALDPRQHDALIKFFDTLNAERFADCLQELLRDRRNEALAVSIAKEYHSVVGAGPLIEAFESRKSPSGLYYFLGGIVNTSEDPAVHFKYIKAAAELKQYKEVERVCRDSTVYNAEEVKAYLLEAQLEDPRPLIHVCDRHGYVEELTGYLFKNKLNKFIEVYVTRVNPRACPKVVGKLIDLDADEKFIQGLITAVPSNNAAPVDPSTLAEGTSVPVTCVVGELVEEVEKRNRLRFLRPFLERKIEVEASIDPDTHNAMGKIRVMTNTDPKEFLANNKFYDSRVLGKFCEKLDPQLAFLCYRRAEGECDAELIGVTNRNGLFKDQARYLVERKDKDLWATVLTDENEFRTDLIDQVVGTALPETKDPKAVSVAVKAFIDADLPQQLIGLLEKLVLHGSDFADNKNLQNLLILTAIRCTHAEGAKPGRAMEYIMRLDKFDGPEIAKVALKDEFRLYEEAFAIYRKVNMHVDAVGVLIDRIGDLDRAAEHAERVDEKDVWVVLGKAQLGERRVSEAVDSLIRAGDSSQFREVIDAAQQTNAWADLVRYLEMARESQKERVVDTELAFALAKCERNADLEVFVTHPNVADIQGVGDRCYDERLFEAGRVLYKSISNYGRMSSCLVHLGQFREAIDAARRANSTRTWKEVNRACVSAGEFRLAQQAGLEIITDPDHVEELVGWYEAGGHFEELISLFESGVGSAGANVGVFTELGILYSKHRPEKLMDHIKGFAGSVNVSKLLRAVQAGRHWAEAAYLQVEDGDLDAAVKTMMDHSPLAFDLDKFIEIVPNVRNPDLYYRSVEFFIEEEPMSLERLLTALTPKLEHARVVHLLKRSDEAVRLAMPYLTSVQSNDIPAVNEAINEVLVDEEDYEGLRASVKDHRSFDQLDLARKLERHELLEFRRIAAVLYKRNRRFDRSVELSKKDRMYSDAIQTAAASADRALAEGLLSWFVEEKEDKECFAACLCTCYGLVRPDVALELAWRHRITDYVMPFMVQYLRDLDAKVAEVDARTRPDPSKDEEEEATAAAMRAMGAPGLGGAGALQLTNFAANPYAPGGAAYGGGGAGAPGAPGGYGVPGAPSLGGAGPGGGPGVPGGYTPDVYTMGGAGPSY